jgi:ribose transport system permease protein
MTIATNGIVFGVLLVLTGGTPPGSTPGILVDVMHRTAASIPIVVFILAGFAILVSLLMSQTTFGKRVYAIGNSVQVARLSGVRIPSVTTAVYAVSGITASFTGVLLTGYAGASYLTMGDRYLLVSIAAVVVGGASIIGGRGHYLGTLGGALFLTLLASVLQSFTSAESVRQIVFGCIILVAVIAVRERREVM